MTKIYETLDGCRSALSEAAKQFRAMGAPAHAELCESHVSAAGDGLYAVGALTHAGKRVILAFEKLGSARGFGAAERQECEAAMVGLRRVLQLQGGAA